MNNKTKILLACPISEKKDYVMREWLQHLAQLEGDFDILLVDNSKNKAYHRKVAKMTKAKVIWRNPRGEYIHKVLADCQNIIRDYAIKGNHTHIFSYECDVFAALDVIPVLLAHNLPVVGFTYHMEFRERSHLILMDNVDFGGEGFLRSRKGLEAFNYIDGTVKRCFNIGIGCLMISREVFKNIPFRYFNNVMHGSFIGNDTLFAQECAINGIPIMCDTSHIPVHKNISW